MNFSKAEHILDDIHGIDSYAAFLLYTSSNGWDLKSQIEVHPAFNNIHTLINAVAKKDNKIMIYSMSEDVTTLERHYDKILNRAMKSNNTCKNYKNGAKNLHVALYKNLFLYLFRYDKYLFIGYCPRDCAFDFMDTLRDLKLARPKQSHT